MPHLGTASVGSRKEETVVWLLRANVHLAAAALAAVGLMLLFSSAGRHSLFRQPDALLGLSNRTLLALLGLLHLGISVWLIATKDVMTQGLVLLWWGVNCSVYFVGMSWLKTVSPLPVVKLVAWKLGASPRTLGFCWGVLVFYLVLGSLAHLLLERRRRKREESEAFIRRWRQSREQGASAEAPQ